MAGYHRQLFEILIFLQHDGIVGHPPYLRTIRILFEILQFEKGSVIHITQGDLRTAADIACHHAGPDRIHNICDGTGLIISSVTILIHILLDSSVQLFERIGAGSRPTKAFDRRPFGANGTVIECKPGTAPRIALDQQPYRCDPAFTAVRNDEGDRTGFVGHRHIFTSPGSIEPDTDTAHQHIHRPVCCQCQIRRIDCAAVVQCCTAALIDIISPHHPESASRRQPLHIEHRIRQFPGIVLPLLLFPEQTVEKIVIFSDRKDAVDYPNNRISPVLLTAVRLETTVGTVVGRFPEAAEAKSGCFCLNLVTKCFFQSETLLDYHLSLSIFIGFGFHRESL